MVRVHTDGAVGLLLPLHHAVHEAAHRVQHGQQGLHTQHNWGQHGLQSLDTQGSTRTPSLNPPPELSGPSLATCHFPLRVSHVLYSSSCLPSLRGWIHRCCHWLLCVWCMWVDYVVVLPRRPSRARRYCSPPWPASRSSSTHAPPPGLQAFKEHIQTQEGRGKNWIRLGSGNVQTPAGLPRSDSRYWQGAAAQPLSQTVRRRTLDHPVDADPLGF